MFLQIEEIEITGGTQQRAEINKATVQEYAELLRDGVDLDAVLVVYDGIKYWLADGFHRYHAHRKAELEKIKVEIQKGTLRDAILTSVAANSTHGLKRSNADKRKTVMTLLNDDEWGQWSDREIAKRCGVGAPLVGRVRADLTVTNYSEDSEEEPQPRTYTTKHGTTATMKTGNIGKTTPKPEPKPSPQPEAVEEPEPQEVEDSQDDTDIADGLFEKQEKKAAFDDVITDLMKVICEHTYGGVIRAEGYQDVVQFLKPYFDELESLRKLHRGQIDIPPKLDTPIFRELWYDFLQHRKEMRKPFTKQAEKNCLMRLDRECRDDQHAAEYIEEALTKNWMAPVYPSEKQRQRKAAQEIEIPTREYTEEELKELA